MAFAMKDGFKDKINITNIKATLKMATEMVLVNGSVTTSIILQIML